MKIGILGSTCDPPHKAHIKMAEVVQKAFKLARVIIIPTKVPPHKASPSASGIMRFKMAKLAVGKRKGWSVSGMELKRKGKSFTRDTIRDLKKLYPHTRTPRFLGRMNGVLKTSSKEMPRSLSHGVGVYPKDELFWIVGSDAIVSMPWKWKGGWGILDLCQFVVFPRPGYSLIKVPKNILKKVIVMKPIDGNLREISSTEIRNTLKNKKSPLKYIDQKVYRFIKKHKLYNP